MHALLESILTTRQVSNGKESVPLSSAVDAEEGDLIQRVVADIQPDTYLEVGFAYGVSALFAGEALQRLGKPYSHHIVDPKQSTVWKGIGIHNMKKAGYWEPVVLHEQYSEHCLPALEIQGLTIDMAFIDGWHTFDHTLLDFFYINRMLRVGGVVIFDDCHFPSVAKVIKHISTYPAYRLYDRTTPMWRSMRLKEVAHRNYRLVKMGRIHLGSSCIALQKISDDRRPWDWHRGF